MSQNITSTGAGRKFPSDPEAIRWLVGQMREAHDALLLQSPSHAAEVLREACLQAVLHLGAEVPRV